MASSGRERGFCSWAGSNWSWSMDPRPSPRILRRDIVQKPIATPPNITTMINAVLVFNNAGQPRLTKFYTQLVLHDMSSSMVLRD